MEIWYWTDEGIFQKERVKAEQTPTLRPRVLLSQETLESQSKAMNDLQFQESLAREQAARFKDALKKLRIGYFRELQFLREKLDKGAIQAELCEYGTSVTHGRLSFTRDYEVHFYDARDGLVEPEIQELLATTVKRVHQDLLHELFEARQQSGTPLETSSAVENLDPTQVLKSRMEFMLYKSKFKPEDILRVLCQLVAANTNTNENNPLEDIQNLRHAMEFEDERLSSTETQMAKSIGMSLAPFKRKSVWNRSGSVVSQTVGIRRASMINLDDIAALAQIKPATPMEESSDEDSSDSSSSDSGSGSAEESDVKSEAKNTEEQDSDSGVIAEEIAGEECSESEDSMESISEEPEIVIQMFDEGAQTDLELKDAANDPIRMIGEIDTQTEKVELQSESFEPVVVLVDSQALTRGITQRFAISSYDPVSVEGVHVVGIDAGVEICIVGMEADVQTEGMASGDKLLVDASDSARKGYMNVSDGAEERLGVEVEIQTIENASPGGGSSPETKLQAKDLFETYVRSFKNSFMASMEKDPKGALHQLIEEQTLEASKAGRLGKKTARGYKPVTIRSMPSHTISTQTTEPLLRTVHPADEPLQTISRVNSNLPNDPLQVVPRTIVPLTQFELPNMQKRRPTQTRWLRGDNRSSAHLLESAADLEVRANTIRLPSIRDASTIPVNIPMLPKPTGKPAPYRVEERSLSPIPQSSSGFISEAGGTQALLPNTLVNARAIVLKKPTELRVITHQAAICLEVEAQIMSATTTVVSPSSDDSKKDLRTAELALRAHVADLEGRLSVEAKRLGRMLEFVDNIKGERDDFGETAAKSIEKARKMRDEVHCLRKELFARDIKIDALKRQLLTNRNHNQGAANGEPAHTVPSSDNDDAISVDSLDALARRLNETSAHSRRFTFAPLDDNLSTGRELSARTPSPRPVFQHLYNDAFLKQGVASGRQPGVVLKSSSRFALPDPRTSRLSSSFSIDSDHNDPALRIVSMPLINNIQHASRTMR